MKRWLFGALAVCLLLSGCRLDSAYETASFYYLDAGHGGGAGGQGNFNL